MNTLASTQYRVTLAINVTAKTEIGSFRSPIDLLDLSMLLFWLLQLQLFFSRIHLPRIRFPCLEIPIPVVQLQIIGIIAAAVWWGDEPMKKILVGLRANLAQN